MNFKLTSKHIFGIAAAISTCLFILISRNIIQNEGMETVKETRTELLSMYLFFICGLTMITIFGALAKNKLLWHHTFWILIYSITTFFAAAASKSDNIAVILAPILTILSTVILGHFNKHEGVKKEGVYLTIIWVMFFLFFKLF